MTRLKQLELQFVRAITGEAMMHYAWLLESEKLGSEVVRGNHNLQEVTRTGVPQP